MNMFEGREDGTTPTVEETKEYLNMEEEQDQPLCRIERRSFLQCLNHNNDNAETCQWAFDMLKECHQNNMAKEDYM